MPRKVVTEGDWEDKEKLAAFRAAVRRGEDDLDVGRVRWFADADSLSRALKEEADKILGRQVA